MVLTLFIHTKKILVSVLLFGILTSFKCSNLPNNCKEINNFLELELRFTVDTVKIGETIELNVIFINKTENDIAILDNKDLTGKFDRNLLYSIDDSKADRWLLEIIYLPDSSRRISSDYCTLVHYIVPEAKDYILLKYGEKYDFHFDIDLKKIHKEIPFDFQYDNKDYGEYSIKIIYQDYWNKHEKSIKERIESNTINVTYTKK